MARLVRIIAALSALALAAALLAAPAAGGRDRRPDPKARSARPAIVRGTDGASAGDRPTSLGVLSRGSRPAASAPRASAGAPRPRAPQVLLGFDALTDPSARPSDTIGAIGETFIVTAVNTQVAVYDRAGTQVLAPRQLDSLHPGSLGRFDFDPKVVYDQYRDTFVLVYLVQEDSPRLSRIIAVAIPDATATDTATWCATSFKGDLVPGKPVLWADYPGLGYDEDRVTITTNQFTFPSSRGRFEHAQVISVAKSQLYDCTKDVRPTVFAGTATTDPNGVPAFTLQPAQTVDLPAASQLLVSVQLAGRRSYLVLWRIKSTPRGLRLLSGTVGIGRTIFPPPGTQSGDNGANPDTWWDAGDDRLISAFYDADANRLYAAHAVGRDLRPDTATGGYLEAVVRWYEVAPRGVLNRSTVPRKGFVGAPEVDTGWPSVATDGSGNLFVTYSRASAITGEFLSAWVAEIPPGSTAPTQQLLTAGIATYDRDPGVDRWGDFTGINRDPLNPAVLATFNQYAVNATTWQQVVHLVTHG
jgi:hypothetical protein